ncbi:MAG: DUF2344 domain-containing protein [Gemmataceae bacterium]|nr:DUF2344 domain-containing protein [Gemmataceae bacterium]
MAPDLTHATIAPDTPPKEAPPRRKFRLRFRKAGDLRLVSHHDLMHVFERMFRRADLLLCVTQGFNPHPKMVFAQALALGIAGLNEILEIEVAQPLDAAEIHTRLARQCPPGIEILSVREIDVKASGRVRRAIYRLPLPNRIDDLAQRCATFLAQTECWIVRSRPNPRRVNLRPFVHELQLDGDCLTMALWVTSTGAARADEVVTALGLQDVLDSGAVIERIELEVADELPPGTEDAPLIQGAMQETGTNDRTAPAENLRPTPIISNPLSFDS